MEKISVVHLEMVKDKELFYDERLLCQEQVCQLARECFQNDDRERVYVCGVDASHTPVYLEVVAQGSLNKCSIEMRDIFKALVLANCAAFFIWHTHTSFGELNVSKGDIEMTKQVRQAGALLGIPLLDHLVVNRETYVSIKNKLWYEEDEWLMKTEKEKAKA